MEALTVETGVMAPTLQQLPYCLVAGASHQKSPKKGWPPGERAFLLRLVSQSPWTEKALFCGTTKASSNLVRSNI